jgi:glutathione synthase/RimK-type ligase-like ATP-grasp enzyme
LSARIGLATCSAFPALAEDDALLRDALSRRGLAVEPVVWDEEAVDWDAYDLVVVRSTWDYAPRRDRFLAWAGKVRGLLNGADVIRWNTDKRYLSELPAVVPTTFVYPGQAWNPPEGEYVVKPAVSAGSKDTARYGPRDSDRSRRHVSELLADGRTAMVQPYLGAVDEHGETALIYFGGEYSHAIRKGQMLRPGELRATDGFYVEENIGAREPDAAEVALADRILDSLRWPRHELLYARVDLIPGPDGAPRLLELELTEPSLFLSFSADAAERLAERVVERL